MATAELASGRSAGRFFVKQGEGAGSAPRREKAFLDGTALFLHEHPVLRKSTTFRARYLNALGYFVKKYADGDARAQAVFDVYLQAFQGSGAPSSSNPNVLDDAKKLMGLGFSGILPTTYRYSFFLDVLFTVCYDNPTLARTIFSEMMDLSPKMRSEKARTLFEFLYHRGDGASIPRTQMPRTQIRRQLVCWKQNRAFSAKPLRTVLITAGMSSGKSTLINALIGKKISRTQNDACTAKIHYIYNKPYEDGFSGEWESVLDMNADEETLMTYDSESSAPYLGVYTYFRSSLSHEYKWCFVDTPGVNSALDRDHEQLSRNAIENGDYDLVLYVLNAENIGTADDRKHLEYVHQHVPEEKVVFVINKLDRYKQGEDCIDKTVGGVRDDLLEIGFQSPTLCPLSAYAALLAKKRLLDDPMNEDEHDDLRLLIRKLRKQDQTLSRFYPPSSPPSSEGTLPFLADGKNRGKRSGALSEALDEECRSLLRDSGLSGLEAVLSGNLNGDEGMDCGI